MHDFAVTERHAIILEMPIFINMGSLMLGGKLKPHACQNSLAKCTLLPLVRTPCSNTQVPFPDALKHPQTLTLFVAPDPREYIFMDWKPELGTRVHVVALDGSGVGGGQWELPTRPGHQTLGWVHHPPRPPPSLPHAFSLWFPVGVGAG